MFNIFLHNTLSGRVEKLVPLRGDEIRMYVCGITPYDEPHLGHGRCYVVFDVLKRVLLKNGYQVRHIQNFTDIDDKIIDRAQQTKQDPLRTAEIYMESFERWMKELNVSPADSYPRVTGHIPDIVQLIKSLVFKGVAYAVDGDVFFSVRKFPDYGRLSKRKLDELTAGARVEVNERKNDPLDFALWKKAKPGEPSWDSPWGKGRPGWHIECSAMAMKFLGEEFDIHGGGLDLIFPHHENEIAQSVAGTGKSFAQMWVHNGFVTLNQEKMSKSLGNFFTLRDILSQTDPMTVRYFLLTQHYRSPLNFSDFDLRAVEVAWNRIVEAARVLAIYSQSASKDKWQDTDVQNAVEKIEASFFEALRNDLNTPEALAALNQLATLTHRADQEGVFQAHPLVALRFAAAMTDFLETLGLVIPPSEEIPAELKTLLQDREAARLKKDWAASDKIRASLKEKGYIVEDTPRGPRLKKIA